MGLYFVWEYRIKVYGCVPIRLGTYCNNNIEVDIQLGDLFSWSLDYTQKA